MMTIDDVNTLKIREDFENIRKLNNTKREDIISKYKFNDKLDARVMVFDRINRILIVHNASLTMYFQCLARKQDFQKTFTNTSDQDRKFILNEFLIRYRHNLLIYFQIVLEDFLRRVGDACNYKTHTSYKKLAFETLNYFSVPDENKHWYDFNHLLANIRNTIHNNGVYVQDTEDVTYRAKVHKFMKKKPQSSGDYSTIRLMMIDSMEMIEYIIEKTKDIPLIVDLATSCQQCDD